MRHLPRTTTLVVALALLPAIAGAQTTHSTLTPMPCPVQAWEYSEPALQPLPGAKAFAGRYDGGLYNIEIPDKWNGDLVLYAHGQVDNMAPKGSVIRVQAPRLRQHWVEQGFAWAASSYRCNGSVYGIGLLDTMALRSLFVKFNEGRAPGRVFLAGQSLGGRITILGLRQFPDAFAGGLAMCAAGQETTDQRVAFRAAAELIAGVPISEASITTDMAKLETIFGKPPDYTPKGRQLASIQIEMTGGPRPFAMEGLARRFLENVRVGVVTSPAELIRASTNLHTKYLIGSGLGLTAAELDTRVRRIPGEGAVPYAELTAFDGKLTRPLLTIQGTGDLQVPISQQQALKRGVVAAGTEQMLVQRIMRIPGHCAFSPQEETKAFDDLVTWVRDGVRPEGDEVLGDLSNAGLKFTEPLRPGDPGVITITAP
jgi:pimeloyl-ACP methyl ester carboxylesterase